LGEHVPYVVEAWPEGGQRHLSAESGLYCRIITEGLLGFRPTGFRSFTLTPQMPSAWNGYRLGNIYACTDKPFGIEVIRKGSGKLAVKVVRQHKILKTYTVRPGQTVRVSM
jgi:cellobiose phosphorylase